MSTASSQQEEVHPHVIELPAFEVIGIIGRTSNDAEFSGHGKIGALWGEFLQGAGARIPQAIDDTIFSLYTNYESDHRGSYDVILGKSVKPGAAASAGTVRKHVSAAKYLVFAVESRSPESIMKAWRSVYCYFDEPGAPKRAFTADFERYTNDAVELFIAIV